MKNLNKNNNVKLNKHLFAPVQIVLWLLLVLSCVGLVLAITLNTAKNPQKTISVDSANTVNVATSFAAGDGTESNPYQIATFEQLLYLKGGADASGNTLLDKSYKLTADISVPATYIVVGEEMHWDGISSFNGIFDGNNKVITFDSAYNGLFVRLNSGAQILNVGIGGTISPTSTAVIGAIAKQVFLRPNSSTVTIKNCYNTAEIIISGGSQAGGIVGAVQQIGSSGSVNIENCHNYGTIYFYDSGQQAEYVGGIVGSQGGGGTLNITNCFNCATIEVNRIVDRYDIYSGGIIGQMIKGTISGCFSNNSPSVDRCKDGYLGGIAGKIGSGVTVEKSSGSCSADGIYYGDMTYIGGVVGLSEGGKVSNSRGWVNMNLSGRSNGDGLFVGGIVGKVTTESSIVSNCVGDGTIVSVSEYFKGSNGSSIGGIVGYIDNGIIVNCVNYIRLCEPPSNMTVSVYMGGIAGYLSLGAKIQQCLNAVDFIPWNGNGTAFIGTQFWGYMAGTTSYGDNISGICLDDSSGGRISAGDANTFNNVVRKSKTELDALAHNKSQFSASTHWDANYSWNFDTVWDFQNDGSDGDEYGNGHGAPYLKFDTVTLSFKYESSASSSNTISCISLKKGMLINLSKINLYSKIGKKTISATFSLNEDGTNPITYYTAGDSDATIYVKDVGFGDIEYIIAYNLDGGILSNKVTSYTNSTSGFYLGTPVKSGYTFTGWTSPTSSTKRLNMRVSGYGNKLYTANWEESTTPSTTKYVQITFDIKIDRDFIVYILDADNNPTRQVVAQNGKSYSFQIEVSTKFSIMVYETLYSVCTFNDATAGVTETTRKKIYENGVTADTNITITISGAGNVNNWIVI